MCADGKVWRRESFLIAFVAFVIAFVRAFLCVSHSSSHSLLFSDSTLLSPVLFNQYNFLLLHPSQLHRAHHKYIAFTIPLIFNSCTICSRHFPHNHWCIKWRIIYSFFFFFFSFVFSMSMSMSIGFSIVLLEIIQGLWRRNKT